MTAIPNPATPPNPADELLEGDPNAPHWMDGMFPWLISLTMHLGVFLLIAFIAYLTLSIGKRLDSDEKIIVPNAFDDPAFSEHPGGIPHPGMGDPTRDAAQDLKQLAKSDGFSQSESQDLSKLLDSSNSNQPDIEFGRGPPANGNQGNSSGQAGTPAPFGTGGGGGGIGPKSSFYGTGGNATKIVYILDHSGSMLDNFDFLKVEGVRSVNNLVAVQHFAVVLVSDKVTFVGPPQLQRALPEAKKAFADAVKRERAEGANDNLLAPFQQAFERAFAMKPELIYFLTDGKFDDGLVKVVNNLNRDKKVHINTIAFVTEEPLYKEQLQQLAKENGGTYHFTPEKELGQLGR